MATFQFSINRENGYDNTVRLDIRLTRQPSADDYEVLAQIAQQLDELAITYLENQPIPKLDEE